MRRDDPPPHARGSVDLLLSAMSAVIMVSPSKPYCSRAIAVVALLLLVSPASGRGQSFQLQGSAGLTLLDSAHNLSYGFDPGFSAAAGFGITARPRLLFLVEAEHAQRASQLQRDLRGNIFGFRGGEVTLGTVQLRAALFQPDRISPYAIVGFAAGRSRLNVNDAFRDPVSNDVRALIIGGGIDVPLRDRMNFFSDWRMIIGGEADDLFAIAPLRAGLGWRF